MYWNLGGSRKKHRLQWKTYMGVCVCVSKSLLNLKLTTSMDWSGMRKNKEKAALKQNSWAVLRISNPIPMGKCPRYL